jgi:hypothetical protein
VVRVGIEKTMPSRIRNILVENLEVTQDDVYQITPPLGFSHLLSLLKVPRPDLKDPPFYPPSPIGEEDGEDIFALIRRGDLVLHHPYDSFAPVVQFIRAASTDPNVLAIKQTLYRTGKESPLIPLFIQAAENGKQGERDQAASTQSESRENSAQGSPSQQASSQTESNSLMDKLKDAMQNLLSRLKTQPQAGESQRAANSPQRSEMGEPREMQGQKGSQSLGKQMGGKANGQPQGEQKGEGAEKAEGGSGKQQGGSESRDASEQGKSGIGKEDGSKDIKQAEQLAAMGKISEIIGRRSQNLTGDVMVEVNSGKQQLRTAYSQQNANHTEAGGAINRDEIPLAYQRYVQQYFEEIRKAPPARGNASR